MAKFIKRRVALGVGLETVRGTGVPATHTIPFTDLNFDDKADKAKQGGNMGSIAGESHQSIVATLRSEGSFESEIYTKSFPVILKATLGALSSAADGAGYKHTVTVLESNQHPTLSLHIFDPNGSSQFRGCMVDSMELNVAQNEIVKYVLSVKGKTSKASSYTKTLVSDDKFVGRDLEMKIAADTAALAGASPISVKTLKLSINKNADYDYVLGTLEPEDIINKQITFKGELTLNYEDKVFKNYMLNGDYKAVGIKLTDSRDDLGGGLHPEFYIEFPRVDFSQWEITGGLDDIVGQKITFDVLYDIATNKVVSNCYVINSTTSY